MTPNDGLDEFMSSSGRVQCQTCGKPGMSLRHRQRCLRNSEKKIYKQLRYNARLEAGKLHFWEKKPDKQAKP